VEIESVDTVRPVPVEPTMSWWLAAAGGTGVAALAGWALVTCPVVISQLAATSEVGRGGFLLGTRLWLLAHGGPAVIEGLRVSLIPLGVTLLIGLILHGVASYAAHQAVLAHGLVDLVPERRRGIALTVAGLMTGVYTVIVAAAAIWTDPGGPGPLAILGAVVLGGLSTLLGARSAVAWRPHLAWPAWTRAIPRAALGALFILLFGGVVATVASLIVHRAMIFGLTEHLEAGTAGVVLLSLLEAVYLPNVVIWAASWTTGAGFSLGVDSTVVLMGNHVDALPNLPLIGALPTVTPAPWANLAWMAWGVLAGVVAAIQVVRARPRARADETALVGGLSGVVAGLLFTLVALVARGSLGHVRLVGLGPLPLTLAVLASTLLGFSGLAAGLVLGLMGPRAGKVAAATGESHGLGADADEALGAAGGDPVGSIDDRLAAVPAGVDETATVVLGGRRRAGRGRVAVPGGVVGSGDGVLVPGVVGSGDGGAEAGSVVGSGGGGALPGPVVRGGGDGAQAADGGWDEAAVSDGVAGWGAGLDDCRAPVDEVADGGPGYGVSVDEAPFNDGAGDGSTTMGRDGTPPQRSWWQRLRTGRGRRVVDVPLQEDVPSVAASGASIDDPLSRGDAEGSALDDRVADAGMTSDVAPSGSAAGVAPAGDGWEDSARLRALGVRRVAPVDPTASPGEETTGPISRRLLVPPVVIPPEGEEPSVRVGQRPPAAAVRTEPVVVPAAMSTAAQAGKVRGEPVVEPAATATAAQAGEVTAEPVAVPAATARGPQAAPTPTPETEPDKAAGPPPAVASEAPERSVAVASEALGPPSAVASEVPEPSVAVASVAAAPDPDLPETVALTSPFGHALRGPQLRPPTTETPSETQPTLDFFGLDDDAP
jgi:hypothetical protein